MTPAFVRDTVPTISVELKLCLAILAATAVLAQGPASSAAKRIEGVVLDRETHQPVEGATVAIESHSGNPVKSSTDARGHFELPHQDEPNKVVFATAPGYRQSAAILVGAGTPNLVINLTKASELRGIVVDADSRKPLAGVPVHAYPGPSKPLVTDGPGFDVRTSEDGSFREEKLSADSEYYLQIEAGARPTISAVSVDEVRNEAAQARRDASETMGFAFNYWPDGGGDVPASGIRTFGGIVDLGEVPLKRIRLRELAGWTESDCGEDDTVEILLENGFYQRYAVGEIPCNSGFEIQNLPDGSFSVFALGVGNGVRQFVSQQFDERTRGPLHLLLAKPVLVIGTIEVEGTPANAVPTDLADLKVSLLLQREPAISGPAPVKLEDSPNRFELFLYPGEAYAFMLGTSSGGLGDKYYLKQVINNGVPLPDIHTLKSYGGDLRVVLSKRTATLQVQVQSGDDKPMIECLVGLLKDGALNDPFAWRDRLSDKDGRVIFSGLAPGKYRVLALPPGKIVDVLSVLMQNATAITLEEDRTATVTLHAAP